MLDPTSLVRIVDNLIGNALKFAEPARSASPSPGTPTAALSSASPTTARASAGRRSIRPSASARGPKARPAGRGPRAAHRAGPGRSPRWRHQPRQPPRGRRRGGAALPRFRCGQRRGTCRGTGSRPCGPAHPARRGQSDQPDGGVADAAGAQRRGHRLLRRRRGAGAVRAGADRPCGGRHRDAADVRPRRHPRDPRPRRRARARCRSWR